MYIPEDSPSNSLLGVSAWSNQRTTGTLNIDTVKDVGLYSILGSDSGQPESGTFGGMLFVFRRNSDLMQVFVSRGGSTPIYYRYQQSAVDSGASWTASWQKIDRTSV